MDKVILKVDLEKGGTIGELMAELEQKRILKLSTDQAEQQVQTLAGKIKAAYNGISSGFTKANFVIGGIRQVVDTIKEGAEMLTGPANQYEQFSIRLELLYGSAERGAEAFEKFKDVAQRTPATLLEVVDAGSKLKAFGLDAENTLENVGDLAVRMGMTISDAADAVGRAYAGGAGAADILRDKGILEMIKSFNKIDDLTKLTLPEFRKALLATLQDPAAGIAGSSARMAQSFEGAMSNMADAWTNLRAKIGEGINPMFEDMARGITSVINNMIGMGSEFQIASGKATEARVDFESLVITYESLHKKVNRSTAEQELYQKAVDGLLEKYPNYFAKIDLEKGKWEDIATAIDGARESLGNYLNYTLQDAATKDVTAKLEKVRSKIIENIEHLSQIQARADSAGKMAEKGWNPLKSSVALYNKAINSAKKEEAELNEQLKRRIELTKKLYPVNPITPKSEDSNKTKSNSTGGGGGDKGKIKSPIDATIQKLREDLMTERELLEEEKRVRDNAIIGATKANSAKRSEALELSEKLYQQKKEALQKKTSDAETKAAADKLQEISRYYENVKFADATYYDWKKQQIMTEVAATGLAADQQETLSKKRLRELDAERTAWEDMPRQAILDQYAAEIAKLADLQEIGSLTYQELAQKMGLYLAKIKESFGDTSSEYKNAMATMAQTQETVHAKMLETYKKEHAEFLQIWDATAGGIVDGWKAGWNTILDTGMTGSQRMNTIWDAMRDHFLSSVGEMTAKYIEQQLLQLAIKLTVEDKKKAAELSTAALEEKTILRSIALQLKAASAVLVKAIATLWHGYVSLFGVFALPAAIASGLALKGAFDGLKGSLGFAEGGLVQGPGTGTSDSIPARLSNGEYVVPADTVHNVGASFFDMLRQFPAGLNVKNLPLPRFAGTESMLIQEIRSLREEVRDMKNELKNELKNESTLTRGEIKNSQPIVEGVFMDDIKVYKATERGKARYKGW